jgi:hypothetical protein
MTKAYKRSKHNPKARNIEGTKHKRQQSTSSKLKGTKHKTQTRIAQSHECKTPTQNANKKT